MKILKNTELDFNDVLIRPKSSDITSRECVDVTREYKFKWSGTVVSGTGIINANMGTIGNFNLARKMMDDDCFACLHKHHESNELYKFYNDILFWSKKRYKCFLSIGLRDDGINKIRGIENKIPPICIDVPNGYISNVVDLVKKVREEFPECILMVGNVVTGDMTKKLIKSGADIVKVGIGGGGQCMLGNTMVKTNEGIKPIQDIQEGDKVLTHTGEYHKVLTKLCYTHHREKMSINDIECTPEHKFLVINKSDRELVSDENLMEYAYWVEACNLDEEKQFLVKITYIIEFIEIKKGTVVENNEKVFDIEVEKDNSFVLENGIVAHNCLTRKQTGVGRPQLSTIIECAKAAHKVGGLICSDGGITCSGDIVKAFGAGADFVMIGSLYAGTDEAEGDIIYEKEFTNIYNPDYYTYVGEGGILTEPTEKAEALPVFDEKKNRKEILRKYKLFYGMSSELAQEKFGNGKSWYTTSEGRVSLVPYTGSVHDMNNEFLGGLRSAMAYIGAKKLEDISKNCEFYRVNNQLNRIYEQTTIGK